MKKIIVVVTLLFSFGSVMRVSAQQGQTRVKFYYYPSSNIYYNVVSDEYVYYDEPTAKWMMVKTLPTTIVLEKSPVDTLYYDGPDVWKDNPMHQKQYKGKKDEMKKKD